MARQTPSHCTVNRQPTPPPPKTSSVIVAAQYQYSVSKLSINNHTRGALQSVAASVMWGATGVWIVALAMPVRDVLLYRFALSLLLAGAVVLAMRPRPSSAKTIANKNDLLAGLALFGYYALTTAAFSRANMVSVSLIVATTPAFVMGAEWLRGRRPARASVAGALLAFGGVAVLLAPAGWSPATSQNHFGEAFALGAVLSMTAFSLLGRAPDSTAAGASLWACLIGAAALFGVVVIGDAQVVVPRAEQWGLLLGLAAFSTLAAAACYANACRLCGATTAAVARLSTPLFAALFLVAVFGGELSARHFIAGALILLGAGVVVMRRAPVSVTPASPPPSPPRFVKRGRCG